MAATQYDQDWRCHPLGLQVLNHKLEEGLPVHLCHDKDLGFSCLGMRTVAKNACVRLKTCDLFSDPCERGQGPFGIAGLVRGKVGPRLMARRPRSH